MTNLIYSPITTKFSNIDFVSIRVDDHDYYIVSELPLDEDGLIGFPLTKNRVLREVVEILYGYCEFFEVRGLGDWVACISDNQLEELFAYFSFREECPFAQDLLMAIRKGDLSRANEYIRSKK
jgi:hypothetical protein